MKLFVILTVCLATVLAQRGDVLIEDEDDNAWNVQGDDWDDGNWRGDTPSWEVGPGPIVDESSYVLPTQNQIIQPVVTGNSPTHFRIENGYLQHMGKKCKVVKGYGGQNQFGDVYHKFGHPGLYHGKDYSGQAIQHYSDVYQGSPMYVGDDINYNRDHTIGTNQNYHPEYSSNIISTGSSSSYLGSSSLGSYPASHVSYPSSVLRVSYPSAQPSYPSAQPSYPSAQPSYPGAQPSYPGAQPSYPSAQPSYPGAQPSYPSAQPSYPSVSSPVSYPNAQSSVSFPSAQSSVSFPSASSASFPSAVSQASFQDNSQQVDVLGSAQVFQPGSSSLSFPGTSNQVGGFSSGFPSPSYPDDDNSWH